MLTGWQPIGIRGGGGLLLKLLGLWLSRARVNIGSSSGYPAWGMMGWATGLFRHSLSAGICHGDRPDATDSVGWEWSRQHRPFCGSWSHRRWGWNSPDWSYRVGNRQPFHGWGRCRGAGLNGSAFSVCYCRFASGWIISGITRIGSFNPEGVCRISPERCVSPVSRGQSGSGRGHHPLWWSSPRRRWPPAPFSTASIRLTRSFVPVTAFSSVSGIGSGLIWAWGRASNTGCTCRGAAASGWRAVFRAGHVGVTSEWRNHRRGRFSPSS